MTQPPIILASTSPYRRALLERLGLSFGISAPRVDESRLDGEPPDALVTRLALSKAQAVAGLYPQALIIGSDQVAVIEGDILGKPGGHEQAVAQLSRVSGKTVVFYTGLCLLNAATGRTRTRCEPYEVRFRRLTQGQITGYVERERPFDCAGSFKSEGLGIALFERLSGDDPNALVGLPLIRLVDMLLSEGVDVLSPLARAMQGGGPATT